MKTQKPSVGVVDSLNIQHYQLTKPQLKLLGYFDELERYQALANKKPPYMRLNKMDYVDIDASIRKQSENKRTLADMNYKGYRILSMGDA
jgi:GTPase involved in cell partitioning and DNA repair